MWNVLTEVMSEDNITCKGYMTEYYPACDMLSTKAISNIAYEY